MNAKEWLDAVKSHLGRPARIYEQRYIARLYEIENTDDTAAIVAHLLHEIDATPVTSVFAS